MGFIISLDENQEKILKLYCAIKYIRTKEEGIKDLINNSGKDYVNKSMR